MKHFLITCICVALTGLSFAITNCIAQDQAQPPAIPKRVPWKGNPDDWSLQVSLEPSEKHPASRIVLLLSTTNKTPAAKELCSVRSMLLYDFDIQDGGGTHLSPTERGARALDPEDANRRMVVVQPGASVTDIFMITNYYQLRPGVEYTVVVRRTMLEQFYMMRATQNAQLRNLSHIESNVLKFKTDAE